MIKVNIEITAPTLPDALEELQSFCRDGQEQAPSGAEAQEESVIQFPAAPRKDMRCLIVHTVKSLPAGRLFLMHRR